MQRKAKQGIVKIRRAYLYGRLHRVFMTQIQNKGQIMAIKTLTAKFKGIAPLLQNNSQSVDPFNKYAKLKKPLTSKRTKTDEDLLEIRDIEVESKVYFDDDIGIYVPSRWLSASLAKNSWSVIKVKKDHIRGALFIVEDKAKLTYDGIDKVKKISDVVKNEKFVTTLILPQQQVRLAKSFPIFHKWEFEFTIEYDDSIFNDKELGSLLEYCAKYNGFGDFRPSYGRCLCEVSYE
jgi:hypothetical protein